mgnify:CR=1 FL=1
MFTMADITRTNAAERPNKLALICDDRSLTYGELQAESCRVANALLDAGVGPQDRVGFLPTCLTLTAHYPTEEEPLLAPIATGPTCPQLPEHDSSYRSQSGLSGYPRADFR